jgi:trk system potassium uptake protein TrkA
MKFCVIGLGRFGSNLANFLADQGNEVLAIDKNELIVNSIKDNVTQAICANITDSNSLFQVGIEDIQTVIVAVGEDFAQSTLITALLKKELKTPFVIARAINGIHETVLKLVGADQVILLEKEMAHKIAEKLSMPIGDVVHITSDFATAQLKINKRFVGKTIKQLLQNKSSRISCIAAVKGGDMVLISKEYIIMDGDILLFAGNKRSLSLLLEL